MKKLIYVIMILFFWACSSGKVQHVDDFYDNGQAKVVMTYLIQGHDSIPLEEIQYHKDGSLLLKGSYQNGEREGEWLSWYPDGTIWSKGFFTKGKRDGKSWIYYPSGKLRMKGSYHQGKKTGKWLIFDEDGVVIGEEEF